MWVMALCSDRFSYILGYIDIYSWETVMTPVHAVVVIMLNDRTRCIVQSYANTYVHNDGV